MKKTLIALSVLVAAGSVNAAEVYSQDGVTLDFAGDVDVQYYKGTENDSDAEIRLDDADFSFTLKSEINEDLKALGFFEFSGEEGDAATGDVYVGFESATKGTVVIGKTTTVFDDLGIGNDYEFGLQGAADNMDADGEEVIRYNYSGDALSFAIAYKMDPVGADDDASTVDGMIGYAAGDFAGRLFVGSNNSDTMEGTAYILEGDYTIDDLLLQATYGFSTQDTGTGDVDYSVVGLAASYSMDKASLNAGWSLFDQEDADEVNNFFVNVDYAIAAQTTVYAEIGINDADDSETGYVVGMALEF